MTSNTLQSRMAGYLAIAGNGLDPGGIQNAIKVSWPQWRFLGGCIQLTTFLMSALFQTGHLVTVGSDYPSVEIWNFTPHEFRTAQGN